VSSISFADECHAIVFGALDVAWFIAKAAILCVCFASMATRAQRLQITFAFVASAGSGDDVVDLHVSHAALACCAILVHELAERMLS
jgi:hypothetical protein